MPDTLTAHQRTVLSYIREFQEKRGYSPSLADLAIAFGVLFLGGLDWRLFLGLMLLLPAALGL